MWRKNRLPIIFLMVLCLGLRNNAELNFTGIRFNFSFDNQAYILDSDSIANSSIAYIHCFNTKDDFVDQTFSVIVQHVKLDNKLRSVACSFKPDGNNEHYFKSELQVILVNEDRVLIGYISRFETMKDVDYEFVSIYMPDCTISKSKISHVDMSSNRGGNRDIHAKKFALANNGNGTFTFLYSDMKKCGLNYCKALLDAEGHVSEPTPWFGVHKDFYTPNKLFAIKNNSSSVEYAVVYLGYRQNHSELVEFAKVNSKGVELKSIESPVSEVYGGYSLAHGLISVCFRTSQKAVNCSQYDLDGNVKFNVHDIKLGYAPVLVQPYNLPNGGLLVFTIACSDPLEPYEDDRVCLDSKSQWHQVTVLNARGEFVKNVWTNGLQYNIYTEKFLKPHLYENEVGEYCVSSISITKNMTKEFSYSLNCFGSGDIEK